jgi:hypothetical protein
MAHEEIGSVDSKDLTQIPYQAKRAAPPRAHGLHFDTRTFQMLREALPISAVFEAKDQGPLVTDLTLCEAENLAFGSAEEGRINEVDYPHRSLDDERMSLEVEQTAIAAGSGLIIPAWWTLLDADERLVHPSEI